MGNKWLTELVLMRISTEVKMGDAAIAVLQVSQDQNVSFTNISFLFVCLHKYYSLHNSHKVCLL